MSDDLLPSINSSSAGTSLGQSERRKVTILNCDIVGSTRITEQLDPEDLSFLMLEFESILQRIVKEHSGYMAGSTGDGFEVYFGFPIADEYAASNAVLASSAFIAGLPGIEHAEFPAPQVRIGIATGDIVTKSSSIPGVGKSVFGMPAPLAARLQEAASPNEILVDSSTRNLCWEFDFEALPPRKLKNISDEVALFKLLGTKSSKTRIEYRLDTPSPFIGRDIELSVLSRRWQKCKQFNGTGVLVTGEPGIGKSRLIHEFTEQPSKDSASIWLIQCSPRYTTSPYQPLLHFLEQQVGLTDQLSRTQRREAVLEFVRSVLKMPDEFTEILLLMLGLEVDDDASLRDISPHKKAQIFKDSIVKYIVQTSVRSPVVLVIEDIHWVDPSTLSIIQTLIEAIKESRVLVLMSSRITHHDLDATGNISNIMLTRLSNVQSKNLVTILSGDAASNTSLIDSINIRTDGNPLYIEEVTRSILARIDSECEDGDRNITQSGNKRGMDVPESLYSILMSRLDKLERAKHLAQIASTIGREFELSLLRAISGLEERVLKELLDQLIATHLVTRRTSSLGAIFSFRHALIQEAAYESQPKSVRQRVHRKIAECLKQNEMAGKTPQPDLVAYHYDEAGDRVEAFQYWVEAGSARLDVGATKEAIALLNSAKEILDSTMDEKPDDAIVLRFLIARGKSLNAFEGAISVDAQQAFREAANLAQQIGDLDTQIHALDSEFGILFNAGTMKKSLEPARMMVAIGKQKNHRVGEISGLQSVGMVHFAMGEFDQAATDLESSLRYAATDTYGLNSYPSLALMYLAWTQFILGDNTTSEKNCLKSIESGRQESPYSHGVSLGNGCYFYQFARNYQKLRDCSEELIDLMGRKGQMMWLSRGLFFRHWLQAREHDDTYALQKMIDQVSILLSAKEEIETTYYLGLIAETQINHGDGSAALDTLSQAIDLADKNNERFYLSQLHRLRGDALVLLDDEETKVAAQAEYNTAAVIAKAQNARCWMEMNPAGI